jgi:hypothetical protein
LLRPEADTRVIGYKEIRYDVPDLAALLTFMRNVFPGARFIFNSRDHAYVLKSKWWANNPNGPEKLQRFQASLDAAQEAHEAVSYRVRYDDYNGHPESLQGLFDFLGEPFDVDRIAAVMAVPHSY